MNVFALYEALDIVEGTCPMPNITNLSTNAKMDEYRFWKSWRYKEK